MEKKMVQSVYEIIADETKRYDCFDPVHVERIAMKIVENVEKIYGNDSELIDWLQSVMTQKDGYCEVYFAGLREGNNDATSFQIESNPEVFETLQRPNIRECIKSAMMLHK